MKKIKIIGLSILLFGISTITSAQNEAPVLNAGATIRQAYCPETEIIIAPDFTITDEDDLGIDSFSIQISSGYAVDIDLLDLTGTHLTIDYQWFPVEGKLVLTPVLGTQILYTDLQRAVRAVVFKSSSSTISGEKYFSLTIGSANYLELTGHFYVFEPDLDITWTDAKIKAESDGKKYFGLQGYLATILSAEENQIAAKQITGTGWIGASDQVTEGVWNWATGPEAGTNFWNGGAAGSAAINPATGIPMYSNWLGGFEPNNSGNNEHYAHIKKNASTWNDLKNAGDGPTSAEYRAEGYIIEYGDMPDDPKLQISASTSIYVPKVLTISADVDVCAGTSVNLTATVTEGDVFWSDNLSGGSLVGIGNTFTTPLLNSSKTYYATASPEGCSTSDKLAVVVTVYAVPVANKPDNIERCDDDGNGFSSFDFDTDITPKILSGQSDADFEVLYFNRLEEAQENIANTNIDSPYENKDAFTLETIYARIQNTKNITCFDITSFTLAVSDLPIPIQPESYRICDNTESGSDTDAIINTFLLHTRDSEILGALDPNQYNISYHTSQNGAETNDSSTAIDKDADHSVTNTQTVFIRVANKDNSACDDASKTLDLIVDSLPEVTDVVSLLQCDDDLDRVSTINLTEAEISISSNYENENFTYFKTEADAIAGTPEVEDKLRYPVDRSATAWVRTISKKECYRISKINIEVEAASDVAYNKQFPSICDDFLQTDGTSGALNNDTDGITNFDFSDANNEILNFFPLLLQADLEVLYFETKEDRTAVINAIPTIENYRNIEYPSDVTRQTIYFKITNKNNNNCSGTGELYLKTATVPKANFAENVELCDNANDGDRTNGFVQSFDLESQNNTILGNQNSSDFTVTYHLSDTDASSGNAPLASPYTNTNRDLQTIFVRVTNNETACYTDHSTFNLIVHPLPIANFVDDLEVCDDNSDGSARNGFSQTIDLESQTSGIIGTQSSAIYSVTYHRDLNEAQNGLNPLVSPFSNTTVNKQTIFVRVFNSDTQCANGISNFEVLVNPEPTFETISNLSECDNNDDLDDTNGIIQTIDLEGKIAEILGASQDPDDYIVTFHLNASFTDAPIVSPYTNTNALETIFVRIQNKATSCINDDASFDIIVNPLPNFTVTTPQILCLNDLLLNITVEHPSAIYTYEWKNANGTNISTNDAIDVTMGGTYTVTATTTNGTNCSRTETIVVNESNIATLENSFITIIDESNNIGSAHNLSISINTFDNDLGPGVYQYAILNTDNNARIPFAGFQDTPLFENLEGGIYKIIVNDKNGCAPDATLLISVIQFPKFFTPNGDGKNDTWVIKGANKTFYPNSSIRVFNRFGKLVAQIPIDGDGWNGTYNGKKLSSDDYWYTITFIPADLTKPTINKKGNFSLIRK
jgi:gliding motility-associated-like protein